MTFCQNFRWLLFSPKKTKNKWHLNQNAALSKTLVRQSPSNRFTSLSLQLWMNHWSFTNMHNSFCAGGKGVKVDIINILYVNFSFFSWGGWCHETFLPEITHPEKPGKTRKTCSAFCASRWAFMGMCPVRSITSAFKVWRSKRPSWRCQKHGWLPYLRIHFFCPKKSCKNPGKGHRNQILNSAYNSTCDTSRVELKTIQNKPTSGKSYIKHFRIVPTFRYSTKRNYGFESSSHQKGQLLLDYTIHKKKQNVESSECSCGIRYVLSSFQDQQGAIFFGSIRSVLSISESRWES